MWPQLQRHKDKSEWKKNKKRCNAGSYLFIKADTFNENFIVFCFDISFFYPLSLLPLSPSLSLLPPLNIHNDVQTKHFVCRLFLYAERDIQRWWCSLCIDPITIENVKIDPCWIFLSPIHNLRLLVVLFSNIDTRNLVLFLSIFTLSTRQIWCCASVVSSWNYDNQAATETETETASLIYL